jgi:hypothetical protein
MHTEQTSTTTTPKLDAFTRAYLICALWTDDPEPGSGEWNEHGDYTIANLASEALEQAIEDCAAFRERMAAQLEQAGDDAQNGHDFWLTRNGHGAGFWDRGYPDAIGDALTAAAQTFGEASVILGDSGRLYIE